MPNYPPNFTSLKTMSKSIVAIEKETLKNHVKIHCCNRKRNVGSNIQVLFIYKGFVFITAVKTISSDY